MKKNRTLVFTVLFLILLIAISGVWWFFFLQKAHSSFENYYEFRGCVQLVEKTDTYATCKVASGEIIKIVLIDNKWYLDGDGPGIW
jgi:uncharacterized protein YpmB